MPTTRYLEALTDGLKAERRLYLSNDLTDQLHIPVTLPSRQEFPVLIEYAVGWDSKQVWTSTKDTNFCP
jgi:hypothetical protein